jgi:lipopolysaccharide export system permease protein
MKILNRYIRSHIIRSTAMVMLVLIGVQSFMEFVDQLSDIGVGHYGALQAMLYVPLQLPSDLYQLFPMAGFLGSLIGLGRLAQSSQLIVMRSSGVSILQISWSVIKASLMMIVVVTLIGEWLAPQLQHQADKRKDIAKGKYHDETQLKNVWLKRNNAYIYINDVSSDQHMENITRFNYDSQSHLLRVAFAQKGELIHGEWQLFDIQETLFSKDKVIASKLAAEPLGFKFEPKMLKKVHEGVEDESIVMLFHNILYRQKTGLVTSQYQYAFWKRIFQPITTIMMICLGIPFIFGSLRSSSMGFRVMAGVIIGFGFYMLNQFFGPITLVYQFPPLLAAALPTLLFMLAYVILLRRAT